MAPVRVTDERHVAAGGGGMRQSLGLTDRGRRRGKGGESGCAGPLATKEEEEMSAAVAGVGGLMVPGGVLPQPRPTALIAASTPARQSPAGLTSGGGERLPPAGHGQAANREVLPPSALSPLPADPSPPPHVSAPLRVSHNPATAPRLWRANGAGQSLPPTPPRRVNWDSWRRCEAAAGATAAAPRVRVGGACKKRAHPRPRGWSAVACRGG